MLGDAGLRLSGFRETARGFSDTDSASSASDSDADAVDTSGDQEQEVLTPEDDKEMLGDSLGNKGLFSPERALDELFRMTMASRGENPATLEDMERAGRRDSGASDDAQSTTMSTRSHHRTMATSPGSSGSYSSARDVVARLTPGSRGYYSDMGYADIHASSLRERDEERRTGERRQRWREEVSTEGQDSKRVVVYCLRNDGGATRDEAPRISSGSMGGLTMKFILHESSRLLGLNGPATRCFTIYGDELWSASEISRNGQKLVVSANGADFVPRAKDSFPAALKRREKKGASPSPRSLTRTDRARPWLEGARSPGSGRKMPARQRRAIDLATEKLEKKFPGSADPGSTDLHTAHLGRSSLSQHVEGQVDIEVDLRAAIVKSENTSLKMTSPRRGKVAMDEDHGRALDVLVRSTRSPSIHKSATFRAMRLMGIDLEMTTPDRRAEMLSLVEQVTSTSHETVALAEVPKLRQFVTRHRRTRGLWGKARNSVEGERLRLRRKLKTLAMGSLVIARLYVAASRRHTVVSICEAARQVVLKVGITHEWMESLKRAGPAGRAAVDRAEAIKAGVKVLMSREQVLRATLGGHGTLKGERGEGPAKEIRQTREMLGESIFDQAVSSLRTVKAACLVQGLVTGPGLVTGVVHQGSKLVEDVLAERVMRAGARPDAPTEDQLLAMTAPNDQGLPTCGTDPSTMQQLENALNLSNVCCLMDRELVLDLVQIFDVNVGLDMDGDGQVVASEAAAPSRLVHLERIFHSLDSAGTGRIDMTELSEILRRDRPMRRLVGLEEDASLESTSALFSVLESEGGSGRIDLKEFLGYFLGSSGDVFWTAIQSMEEERRQGATVATIRTERPAARTQNPPQKGSTSIPPSPSNGSALEKGVEGPAASVAAVETTPPPSPRSFKGFRSPIKFLSTMLARSARDSPGRGSGDELPEGNGAESHKDQKEAGPFPEETGAAAPVPPVLEETSASTPPPPSEDYVRKEDMDVLKEEMSSIKSALNQLLQASGLAPNPSPMASQ